MSDTYARICETRNSVSKERSLDGIWYEKCMEYSDLGDPLARQVAIGIGKELEGQSILLDLSNTRALAGEAGIELPDIKRIVQKMINN